jgi:hypothetical protein
LKNNQAQVAVPLQHVDETRALQYNTLQVSEMQSRRSLCGEQYVQSPFIGENEAEV